MRTFELLILSAVAVVIKSKSKKSENSVEESCSEKMLPTAINTFSLELYKKLILKAKTQDVFFSPFSITSALSMLLLGADKNTRKEMEEVLHVAGMNPDGLHSTFNCLNSYLEDGGIIKMANRLYPNNTLEIKQDFLDKIQEYYGVTIDPLNFKNVEESRAIINEWVAKQTQDQIKEFLQRGDIHALTINVLVNAIYFKGEWKVKFDIENTKKSPFSVDDKKTVFVDMMTVTSKYNYYYSPELRADFLELPFNQNGYPDLSMVLLVPYDTYGLGELESKLTHESLQRNIDKMSLGDVRLYLPKFRLNSRYDLSGVLEDLGMHDLFSRNVDLSLLTDDPSIEVSSIIHEATVVVNEEGTEAVAATGVQNVRSRGPPVIICDRPFIFLVRDVVSETIVFMGRVVQPKASSNIIEPPIDMINSRILVELPEEQQDLALILEKCKGDCRQECRDNCFKDVPKKMKMENTKSARNHFKKNKHRKNFGKILIRYKECKVDCKKHCLPECSNSLEKT